MNYEIEDIYNPNKNLSDLLQLLLDNYLTNNKLTS